MWPFDGWLERPLIVRVGRASLQAWADDGSALRLLAACSFEHDDAPPDAASIAPALAHLTAQLPSDRRNKAAHLVLESSWLPVSLLEIGAGVISQGQADAFARHRFTSTYGPAAQAWHLRLEYLAGDTHAMAFALPSEVKDALIHGCMKSGLVTRSIQPALGWGWDRLIQKTSPRAAAWWCWLEQDRAMLARVERGRLRTLHPAVEMPSDIPQLRHMLRTESARNGLTFDAAEPACLAGWQAESSIALDLPCHWLATAGREEVAA